MTSTSPSVEAQPRVPSLYLEECAAASAVGLLSSQDSFRGLDINSWEDLETYKRKQMASRKESYFIFCLLVYVNKNTYPIPSLVEVLLWLIIGIQEGVNRDFSCHGNILFLKLIVNTQVFTLLFFTILLMSILFLVFVCLFFWLHLASCGILVPLPEIEPGPLAVWVQSPNHWTAREFPHFSFLNKCRQNISNSPQFLIQLSSPA